MIVQGEDAVALGLLPPEVDHPGQALGFCVGQIVQLGDVLVEVIDLPGLGVVVRAWLVKGDRFPALVPDGSIADHLEVLRGFGRGRIGIAER